MRDAERLAGEIEKLLDDYHDPTVIMNETDL